ncbi:DNA helicase-2/ATP-dependent DNA helicase PcrA [Micromonospora violae]|uniref:DNA helicase-2/ATP-dependent DNA helicase PcrA n=1 Tax=Micromonospora violae TaxID=1278207 RepID=A0A4Q7UH21_9ACTN|nr:ATP-dependent helicase [Micromonospora violae]RZT79678.1 DNA helicase-2/ATP-dependent DNA helicase PcrA [Micromonospora violae]
MTRRIDAQDTDADRRIRDVLGSKGKAGFIVTAGAGSGKTTSLVKALAHVTATRRAQLRARTQRIACITYTEVAVAEIHGDVQDDPLVYVSTIHSFLWEAIAPFQSDIGAWIKRQLTAKLDELSGKIEKAKTPAKRDTMTQDWTRYQRQLAALRSVRKFTYSVGPDYGRGQIGHADVLKMVPRMLIEQPLLAKVIATRFPIVFVDESQDTEANVVASLIHTYKTVKSDFCLGFFGDPMQQIYPTGIGQVPAEPDWALINKPENFRSSRRVLEVVNRVRAGADGNKQTPGRPDALTPDGDAYFIVLPTDADRVASMDAVRRWLAHRTSNDAWAADGPDGVKILVAMHKLAARRLGFADLHAAFHPKNPPALATAFIEGTAWPITPFANVILPLCDPSNDHATLRILRKHSALIRDDLTGAGVVRERLTSARKAVTDLRDLVAAGGPGSVGKTLRFAHHTKLIDPVPQLARYLDPDGPHGDQVLSEKAREILDAFMTCDVRELQGYLRYVSRQSPYSTQHATKGAEFPRVIVLLDDSEGVLPAYSYDKLLGLTALSQTDRENKANGKDTTVERSRRLLYVCVSRAREELAVIVYADNVEAAILSLKVSGLADEPLTLSDLASVRGAYPSIP